MQKRLREKHEMTFINNEVSIDKIANANTVVGDSIITNSGTQIIPLSAITILNLGGSGEYGDSKMFKEIDGFKLAGGKGVLINLKPKGFLVDDGKTCRLLKMEEGAIDAIIGKTGEFINNIKEN